MASEDFFPIPEEAQECPGCGCFLEYCTCPDREDEPEEEICYGCGEDLEGCICNMIERDD